MTDNDKQLNFISAISARTIQAITTNPVYVIKTRFEVIGFNEYNSLFDAITKIYTSEGAKGFMTGLKVGIMRDVPFTGIYYPIYEEAKHIYAYLLELEGLSHDKHNDKSTVAILTSAASFTATVVS